ncbi:MAG: Flp1 family type IVb pilin [Oligoflexia bacterium]|nr:Flp1 family type IVb pilin [Oligoflexia bacterium]
MKKIKSTLKRLWQDESGQGATEYILMIVVVIALVMLFKDKILDMIGKRTDEVSIKLRDAIAR